MYSLVRSGVKSFDGLAASLRRPTYTLYMAFPTLRTLPPVLPVMLQSTSSSAIATAHIQCIDSFHELLVAASSASGWHTAAINNVLNRYNMWAGNMGAMHSGQQWKKSLDYRLREASFYKVQVWIIVLKHMRGLLILKQVLRLLEDLRDSVRKVSICF
jgi:hypothetical protein